MGTLQAASTDMWYIEGRWVSAATPVAREFEALAGAFDTKLVYRDPTKGTRVVLFEEEETDGRGTHALVMSLSDGQLLLRQVVEAKAVEWLVAHVQ